MKRSNAIRAVLMTLVLLSVTFSISAETVRERVRERFLDRAQEPRSSSPLVRDTGVADELMGENGRDLSCSDWSRQVKRLEKIRHSATREISPTITDLSYGSHEMSRMDIYLPRTKMADRIPVIVMVHGGAWCVGDKADEKVVVRKVDRWVSRGFAFISINYPMVNEGANALAQANYVAQAVAFVQSHAAQWGVDPERVMLMGHSAGAHLVSLVNADKRIREGNGLKPLLGTISLDAGAMDVVQQMPNVYPFLKTRYREAFGGNEHEWIKASPFHQLDGSASPWLGVCSTTRKDHPCMQAQSYAEKSLRLGIRAEVLPERRSHGEINGELGEASRYTHQVEAFMASLDPLVARFLNFRPAASGNLSERLMQ